MSILVREKFEIIIFWKFGQKRSKKLTKTYIFHHNFNDLESKKWVFWKPFSRTRIDFCNRIMMYFWKSRGVNVCDLLILNHLFSYLLLYFCSKLCFFKKSWIMGRFWKKTSFLKFFGQNQNSSIFRHYCCDWDQNCDF